MGCALTILLVQCYFFPRLTDTSAHVNLQNTEDIAWAAGVLCGAAASGNFTWTPEHVAQSLVCMTMSGPFLTGYTQTINDYYDREIDAINEPSRPIPSGLPSPSLPASGESSILGKVLHAAFPT